MLLDTETRLEDCIVRALARRPSLTIAELHQTIEVEEYPYSVPAVYKECRKLIERGVLVKQAQQLRLSLSWIRNIIDFADAMYDTHIESISAADILPSGDEVFKEKFSHLARVDDFWIHAILLMLQHSGSKTLYQWLPHPWFNLMNSHKSLPFHNALRAAGYRAHNIVGGDTYLDKRAARLSTKGAYEYSLAPGPFQGERIRYYSVSDTFLMTIKLSKQKAREVDAFYDKITSANDVHPGEVYELVSKAPGTVITIDRRPKNVRNIWNKFQDYYSVSGAEKL